MKVFKFFLGGDDGEMRRIAEILAAVGVDFVDAGLGWGAKGSDYGTAVFESAVQDGFTPVLIELELDCDLPEEAVIVDHHGDLSDQPPALIQVAEMIGHQMDRIDMIIAANDAGFYPGLLGQVKIPGMGRLDPQASADEIAEVRGLNTLHTGERADQEAEIDQALASSVEKIGEIRVVRISHSKTGRVGDRMVADGEYNEQGFPVYIVFSGDGEINFSGPGKIARELDTTFPGGWTGGVGMTDPEGSAFWGGYPDHAKVEAFLKERFS
jgi:hypothetical protein